MTTTTKVETRTYADLSVWGKRFDKRAMKELAGYLSSQNYESQTIAYLDDGDDNDIKSTGTGTAMVNGVFIPSLPADAVLVIADQLTGDGPDIEVADSFEMNYLVLATAGGVLSTWQAGVQAATGASVVKFPKFDTSLYVAVGHILWDNDDATAAGNLGDAAADLATDGTFYQLLGATLPHPDNFAN
jgi:hypothetical protein